MATTDLNVSPRTVLGKKVSRLRREGLVPANIYGRHIESTAISVPAVELRRVLRASGHTGLISIAIAGDSAPRTVLVRDVRREAMTGNMLHVDFQQVSMTVRMTVRVPVVLIGQAPVADIGGVVYPALDSIEVECLPGDIPQHVEVDISGMSTPDAMIHVSDLVVPGDVTILTDPALVLASVTVETGAEEEEAAEAAGEQEEPSSESTSGA